MSVLFRKSALGCNPCATQRDVIVMGGIAAAFFAVALTLFACDLMPAEVLCGGAAGMLPSILMVLPVTGIVPRAGRATFIAALDEMGFLDKGQQAGEQLYEYKGPRWARWDSNRVLLRERADGDADVVIPLYVSWQLKRFARAA